VCDFNAEQNVVSEEFETVMLAIKFVNLIVCRKVFG
jgi:hypothetical protein